MSPQPVDPASPDAVRDALAAYLTARGDLSAARIVDAPAPVGNGFDSFIYGFRLGGEAGDSRWRAPLILRLQRKPEDALKVRRESDVQAFIAGAGYPTPSLLAVEDASNAFGLPFAIMERVPGTTVLGRVTSNPLRAFGLLPRLGELHARLHRLPGDGSPFESGAEPITMARLARTRRGIADLGLTRFEGRMAWLEGNVGAVLPETPAITHNDFHPLNVLSIEAGEMSVIDWSDAALGDRHFDIARTLTLFSFAYIAASSRLEHVLLKAARGVLRSRYLKGYEAAFPLDRSRLAYYEALQSMYALVQLAELEADPRSESTPAASRMLRGLPALMKECDIYVARRIAVASEMLGV